MNTRYEILVNGKPLNPTSCETAESPAAAVDTFLTRVYGSALSPRAPYNISARRFVA